MNSLIHVLQEFNRCLIHSASLIAHPVNDTADRIHTQTVEMILRQPVICRRLHERHDLAPRIDKVACTPFAVRDVACRIFVELRSVILFESIVIICKMRWDEVNDRTDSRVMQLINQLFQLRRCPVA